MHQNIELLAFVFYHKELVKTLYSVSVWTQAKILNRLWLKKATENENVTKWGRDGDRPWDRLRSFYGNSAWGEGRGYCLNVINVLRTPGSVAKMWNVILKLVVLGPLRVKKKIIKYSPYLVTLYCVLHLEDECEWRKKGTAVSYVGFLLRFHPDNIYSKHFCHLFLFNPGLHSPEGGGEQPFQGRRHARRCLLLHQSIKAEWQQSRECCSVPQPLCLLPETGGVQQGRGWCLQRWAKLQPRML